MSPTTDVRPEEANKEVVARFVAALGAGDDAALAELLHPDATWWLPGRLPVSGRYVGRDAVVDGFLAQGLALYEPGTLSFEVVRMIAEGDQVGVEWVASGRSAGGRDYRNHYNVAFTVRDRQVHEVREYCDTLYVHDVLYAGQP
jgi:uncharacterized protein